MIHQDRGRGARRVLALLGTAALALGGVVAAGTAAQADDPLPSIANIVPPQGGGSVIVHKHAGKQGPAGNGTVITDPAKVAALGVGIDGVKFKIERVSYNNVPIDLSTAEGWSRISAGMTPADITGNYSKTQVGVEQTTSGGGLTTFSGLAMGLYVVTETFAPEGVTPLESPFLVTVPYPDPAGNTWLYDVNVYPKNRIDDTPTKTVTDPTWLKQGEIVTWTLNVPVPAPPGDATAYTKFQVTDALDSRLGYVADSATVTLNGNPVAAGDYTLTAPSSGNGNTLTVAFDPTKVRTGQVYVITFQTAVNGAGEILNDAVRNVNDTDIDHMKEQVNFGKLKVIKKRQGSNLTLQGAQFELWKNDKSEKIYGPTATNSSGEIVFDSIGLGKGADKTEKVCIKETVPPPGYSIIGDGWTCDIELDAAATNATVERSVDNPPRETPALPLTGAAGTAMFMAGGIALILVASGAAIIAIRRRGEAANRR